MDIRKQIKVFQRMLARHGMFATAWLLKFLPGWALEGLTRSLVAVGYCLVLRQKSLARESLSTAFGQEKSSAERERIVEQSFSNIGRGMVEMLYLMSHPSKLDQKVFCEGREHLDRALQEGKGAIVVTAHFGNFPLMMLYFAHQGYKVNTIMRPARDEKLEQYLLKQRIKLKINTVYALPRKECVMQSLKVLRNNEMLFIPLDQNFGGGGGVFVDFFGQKAATATGPVIFARRTQSPILLMFIVRQNDHRHKIIIEPPLALEEGKDEESDLLNNTQKITQVIEKYIRRYPQEWGWMHRRWKSRPG